MGIRSNNSVQHNKNPAFFNLLDLECQSRLPRTRQCSNFALKADPVANRLSGDILVRVQRNTLHEIQWSEIFGANIITIPVLAALGFIKRIQEFKTWFRCSLPGHRPEVWNRQRLAEWFSQKEIAQRSMCPFGNPFCLTEGKGSPTFPIFDLVKTQ